MLLHKDPLASIDMRDAVYIQNMTIVEEAMCAGELGSYHKLFVWARKQARKYHSPSSIHRINIVWNIIELYFFIGSSEREKQYFCRPYRRLRPLDGAEEGGRIWYRHCGGSS